ncbi:MAG: DUF559 domain-containing protein [Pseudolysinimonas sp.]
MQRAPLPDRYRSGAFRFRDARAEGVRAKRLWARDLDRPVWGVRRAGHSDDAFRDRLEAYASRLRPDAFFSHSTAARLLRIPLPLRLELDADVHVAVLAPDRAPHAKGLRGHRLDPRTRIVTRSRLRVSSPCDTWRDLASQLSLIDLVAAGDHIIHHRLPMATRGELAATVKAAGHRRGSVTVRAALELLDARAESPQESRLRVILTLGGLPAPRINYVVVSTETGKDARVDFAYDALRLALEYQGDYHRTKSQWRKDMTRRTRLEASGWHVMELNADDLRDPLELVARIRATIALRP